MVAPGMALTRVLLPPLLLCATRAAGGAQHPLLAPSAQPAPPIGAVINGTCGHTDWSLACDTASRGAFDARKEGIQDLAGCVARVKQCKQGAFASFSVDHNDCSWYSTCDGWPRLEDATLYQTEKVRGPPPPPGSSPSPPVSVEIDWTKETRRTSTAATVEVDVMPFLARQPETDPYIKGHYGGPFDKYYSALSNLNASYVRFAPWCPNPRLVVPELTPPDCTGTSPATNWNSTFFDQLMTDFMTAVCGPDAVHGSCDRLSVIQQLSTMPSWMYVGGMDLAGVPANPYIPTPGGHKQYEKGGALKDPSCKTMARHIGRVVGWYTKGGFHDDCGHWHHSGFNYSWYGLSILNEDEHGIKPEGGVAYTTCFDAVVKQLEAINSSIIPVGPEISGGCDYPGGQFDYLSYYLNKSNHEDGYAPLIGSYHIGINGDGLSREGCEDMFTQWDSALSGFVPAGNKLLEDLESPAKLILNEFVNSVQDWCASSIPGQGSKGSAFPGGKPNCPDWQQNASAGGDPDLTKGEGIRINRKTWAWNAAAGSFAYAFGTLAEHGYLLVGHDQLVAGTWPDNEPAVAMLDWYTGDPNAKYYVTQLLASTVGAAAEKALYPYTAALAPSANGGNASDYVYALPYRFTSEAKQAQGEEESTAGRTLRAKADGPKSVLLINKKVDPISVTFGAELSGAKATVVEVNVAAPHNAGFLPPLSRAVNAEGRLELGPLAVAVVEL